MSKFQEKYENFLAHYGIPGMQWGARRKKVSRAEAILGRQVNYLPGTTIKGPVKSREERRKESNRIRAIIESRVKDKAAVDARKHGAKAAEDLYNKEVSRRRENINTMLSANNVTDMRKGKDEKGRVESQPINSYMSAYRHIADTQTRLRGEPLPSRNSIENAKKILSENDKKSDRKRKLAAKLANALR